MPTSKRLETGVLLVAVAAFFAITCAISQTRLIWYDEIFTRQVVDLGSWKRIVAALHHGIDLQPPLFYFLTVYTRNIGGEEVGLRLPAMLAFTFAGFSLYVVARRWFPPGYAIGAAVTPWILFFGELGMEARPYGLVIGFAALALLGWTFRDRAPLAGRVGYIAGMLGAAAAHYYGFMIAAPFGIAAVWTLLRERRWDLCTILGCVCAGVTDLWNIQLIREGIAIYKNGAWNPPSWRVLANSLYGGCFAVLAALFLVYSLLQTQRTRDGLREESPPGESVACWAGFSAIPILAMFMARAVSGMFGLRYFSMFSLGYGLLLAYLLERAAKRSRLAGYIAGCGALIAFGCTAALNEGNMQAARERLFASCDRFAGFLEQPAYRDSPFLIGDPHMALQLALYCEDLRNRIVFATDPARALAYLGHNTDDKAMLLLRESAPIRIEPLDEFLRAERRRVLVYHNQLSYLREYFLDQPEIVARLRLFEETQGFILYTLDPAPSAGGSSAGAQ